MKIFPAKLTTVQSPLKKEILIQRLRDITVRNFFSKDNFKARFRGKVTEHGFRISLHRDIGYQYVSPLIVGEFVETDADGTKVVLHYEPHMTIRIIFLFFMAIILTSGIIMGDFAGTVVILIISILVFTGVALSTRELTINRSSKIIINILNGTHIW